jgi:hypothetical protein
MSPRPGWNFDCGILHRNPALEIIRFQTLEIESNFLEHPRSVADRLPIPATICQGGGEPIASCTLLELNRCDRLPAARFKPCSR